MDKVNEKILGISIEKIEKGLNDLFLTEEYVKELKEALAKSVLFRIRWLRYEDKDTKMQAMPEVIDQGAPIDDLYTFLYIFDNYKTQEFIKNRNNTY